MGTMLYSKGIFINRCFDELNLSLPELMKETHREYVKAGAEILETNTFGANRARLASFGLAEKLNAINHAGVSTGAGSGRRCGVRGRRDGAARHSDRAAGTNVICRSARFFPRTSRGRWWKRAWIC